MPHKNAAFLILSHAEKTPQQVRHDKRIIRETGIIRYLCTNKYFINE